ncbi:glycosyltransferase family 39 protein [uncultured Brevundimonas sp.]|uniref:ArnT family glycosyltransferase n=1 Tax=uncultured Brevundimonas sp. TaxID=213418 RepID=UPI002614387A|nr:glycosyltransferase family 39 protein [uncultured Brevundimonas sp.]
MTRPNLDRFIVGWRGPLLAAMLTLLAGLPGLLLLPPLDRDESRFAQATSQMLESGDYIDIRFQDDPRWKKPVGIYWAQAAVVGLVSDPADRAIQPYRIPSLLGAMLAAAALAWLGSATLGHRAGFLAGAMLGATFLLSTEAGIAKTDALLCGLITLAMAALARIYLATRDDIRPSRLHKLLFWAALGASILVKGPIGPMVIGLTLISLSLWDRNIRWLGRLGWGWGIPLLAIMLGPWAIAITIATDGGFWREALGGDLAPKLVSAHESHGAPPGTYLLLAPLLLFPTTLLLPAALVTAWKQRKEPLVRFAICWLVPAWIAFELVPTKLVHYTLPTFGALTLLMAIALTKPLGRFSRWVGAALGLAVAVLLSFLVLYGLTEFGRSTAQTWANITIVCLMMAAAIGGFMLVNRAAVTAVLAAMIFGIIGHAGLAGTLRQLKPLSVSPQLVATMKEAGIHPAQGHLPGPVAIAGYHEPSFVFLTGRETQLTDGAGAAKALAEGRPVIVEARQEQGFRTALSDLGKSGRSVGEVRGHNYSNGDDVRLTVYAPSTYGGQQNSNGKR